VNREPWTLDDDEGAVLLPPRSTHVAGVKCVLFRRAAGRARTRSFWLGHGWALGKALCGGGCDADLESESLHPGLEPLPLNGGIVLELEESGAWVVVENTVGEQMPRDVQELWVQRRSWLCWTLSVGRAWSTGRRGRFALGARRPLAPRRGRCSQVGLFAFRPDDASRPTHDWPAQLQPYTQVPRGREAGPVDPISAMGTMSSHRNLGTTRLDETKRQDPQLADAGDREPERDCLDGERAE